MTETTMPRPAARFVGQSVTRKEDARLLTGHGEYVDDTAMPRMLHAAFVRSETARAAITSIDTTAAAAAPGVVAESRYVAEDACELVEVEYEPAQAVVDFARAADDTDNVVHAAWGLETNAMVAMPFIPLSADLD